MITTLYKKFVLTSATIAVICFIIHCILDANLSDYKSDFITGDAFYPIEFAMVIANALLIALLSTTIFLNHYEVVKNNIALNSLTWFLLPIGWIVLILINTNSSLFDFSAGLDSPAIFVLINTLPYVGVSVFLYVGFRRTLVRTV